jgi:hypothetical protein
MGKKKKKKNCYVCGKEFETDKSGQKLCGRKKCEDKYYKKG